MRVLLVAAATLFMAAASDACDVDECASGAGIYCPGFTGPTMRISVCPQGDFETIGKGCGGSGAYIWVAIYAGGDGCYGDPVPGIPPTDFWIGACSPSEELSLCAGPIVADSMTGANGRTTFSGVLRASGCALSGGIWIACQGRTIKAQPCPNPNPLCLSIIIKSPDMTGAGGHPDGVVDLSDLVPFGLSYNKNLGQVGYNACCDYNDDDQCQLTDFAFFGTHYQDRCQ